MAHGEAPHVLEKCLLFLEGISCSFWLELSGDPEKPPTILLNLRREVLIGFRAQTIWNCCSAIEVNLIIYVALVGSYVYYHG